MPPQWTNPLDISVITPTPSSSPAQPSPPPKPLASASFDFEAQFRELLHDVPTTDSISHRVQAAESRFRRNETRVYPPSTNPNPYPKPCLHPIARFFTSKSRPRPVLRLNRLHPPVPDLETVAHPVRSEFMRVSAVAAGKYAVPPDPADEHDHSLFEFPSVLPRRHSPRRDDPPQPLSSQEPRRRNIQHLIERYNNNYPPSTSNHTAAISNNVATTSSHDPNSPSISPTSSHTHPQNRQQNHALKEPHNQPQNQPQFNIQSVRDIFERHMSRLPNTDISLSSITDSASPSSASNRLRTPVPPLQDNRPQRIAFADLTNTLDLSPCASSTSDSPDERQVPMVTPPRNDSPTVLLPENFVPRTGRKKSFAAFSRKPEPVERGRAKSFAQGERFPGHGRWSDRRFTTAGKTKKHWVSMQLRACGGSVRRRLESFRNMISADDY